MGLQHAFQLLNHGGDHQQVDSPIKQWIKDFQTYSGSGDGADAGSTGNNALDEGGIGNNALDEGLPQKFVSSLSLPPLCEQTFLDDLDDMLSDQTSDVDEDLSHCDQSSEVDEELYEGGEVFGEQTVDPFLEAPPEVLQACQDW